MIKTTKQLTNKEVLNTVQSILNDREEFELENGCYRYKLKIQKGKCILQVYEDETDDTLYAEFETEMTKDPVKIVKGFIFDIYESTLNCKQQFARQTSSVYRRKIKSIANWTQKNKMDKVHELTKQLTERFIEDKRISNDIVNCKTIVKEMYYCLSLIDNEWKQKEIRDRLLQRCKEFNINNVGCSFIENEIIAYRHADDSTIISKGKIVIDTAYCNINNEVNELVNQLRKVA